MHPRVAVQRVAPRRRHAAVLLPVSDEQQVRAWEVVANPLPRPCQLLDALVTSQAADEPDDRRAGLPRRAGERRRQVGRRPGVLGSLPGPEPRRIYPVRHPVRHHDPLVRSENALGPQEGELRR